MSKTVRAACFLVCAAPIAWSHESFLPLHEHGTQTHEHHGHAHQAHVPDGKSTAHVHHEEHSRWAVATGLRYTRYSLEDGRALLWETGLGFDYAVLPWLHLGGDVSYGWFDSKGGSADGWLVPHAHVDFHLPLGSNWEAVVGLGVGFPGGEAALVGDHWSWEPHLELRYDRRAWFFATGVNFTIISGETHDEHEHEHGDEEEVHEHDHEERDFHEIVDPHGQRELRYYGAFGVRMFDERLALEARLTGVHITSGTEDNRNYLRGGIRASWRLTERVSIYAEGNVPLTDAQRNDWQSSAALRIAF